jgi:hypothetical protein
VVTIGIFFSSRICDRLVGHRAAVLDAVDAELGHAADAGVEGGVRGDRDAVAVGLVDDGLELGVGELDPVVARHDLDQSAPPRTWSRTARRISSGPLASRQHQYVWPPVWTIASPVTFSRGPGKMPCSTACLAARLVRFMPEVADEGDAGSAG